jgi:hypothetical protein
MNTLDIFNDIDNIVSYCLTDALDGVMTERQVSHLEKVFKGIFGKAIDSVKISRGKERDTKGVQMRIKVKFVSCLLFFRVTKYYRLTSKRSCSNESLFPLYSIMSDVTVIRFDRRSRLLRNVKFWMDSKGIFLSRLP